jgi:opacity protein-like surface antigen
MKPMRSVKFILAAGAASLMSTAVFAADMAIAPPPPQMYAPPPVEDFGGWYLRGDIGQTNTKGNLHYRDMDSFAANNTTLLRGGAGFSSGTSYGLGVGYQFNNWFRADVTGEYRSKVTFNGTDFVNYNPGGPLSDTYTGGYSSWVGLVNAYVDLGTWWCVTPFIGAGVGVAHVTTTGMQDTGTLFTTVGTPPNTQAVVTSASQLTDGASKTNLAWAAHAGLAYKVNNNFTVELAYRYMNLGTAVHGNTRAFAPGGYAGPSSFQYRDLTSQDVRIGVRWNLDAAPAYAPPPPLIRKG